MKMTQVKKSSHKEITRRVMNGREPLQIRAGQLQNHLHFCLFEQAIYSKANQTASNYDGGSWSFIALSNNSWFMVPKDQKKMTLLDWSGRELTMSAEAAGLAITILTVNHMSWRYHELKNTVACQSAVEHWQSLMNYACQHKEYQAILEFLD